MAALFHKHFNAFLCSTVFHRHNIQAITHHAAGNLMDTALGNRGRNGFYSTRRFSFTILSEVHAKR